jgi:hypothetical protein
VIFMNLRRDIRAMGLAPFGVGVRLKRFPCRGFL